MLFIGQAANFSRAERWRHLFAIGTKSNSRKLKNYLAERFGSDPDHVALTANGRSALTLALKATVPRNSKVVMNGLTCKAVLEAIKGAKCVPIFADIEPTTLHFDLNILNKIIKKHPDIKALIIQNTLGVTVDIAAIKRFAKQHNLVIIEDLAHCVGQHYKTGDEVGTIGDATALSFSKNKVIDTITGGAAIVKNPLLPPFNFKPSRQKLSDTLRARWYPVFGSFVRALFSVHLFKISLGILLKLRWIERSADAKLDTKKRLTHWQAKLALQKLKNLPQNPRPIREFFLIQDREQVLQELQSAGFYFNEIWYDVPIAPARYYQTIHFPEKDCPNAVKIAASIINLPNFYSKSTLAPARKIIKEYCHD